jgi:hypothetical protein
MREFISWAKKWIDGSLNCTKKMMLETGEKLFVFFMPLPLLTMQLSILSQVGSFSLVIKNMITIL